MSHIEDRFSGDQSKSLAHARELLKVRMKDKKKRYRHSLGVADAAVELASAYGVDEFDAACAGLVHDWDKVLDNDDLLARAIRFGISVDGSPYASVGLLHGPVAARELPELFPEFSPTVFQAVARHTVGAEDMTDLDMVVFIADAIEPNRRGDYADDLRRLVGKVSLTELFFQCFSRGLVYVLETGRYMYPTAISIYNHYVQKR